jgi:hypothetical protein
MVWAAGLVAALVFVGACGLEDHHRPSFHDEKNETPEFSDTHLDDPFEKSSAADFLSPTERDAVRRSGMTGFGLEDDPDAAELDEATADPPPAHGTAARAADKAGKVGVALLSVGVTLGALVAPFFLF